MRGRGEGWGIVAWSSQDQAILQAMLASDIDECRSTVIWYSMMSRSALLISQKRVNDHLVHLYLQSDAHSSPSVRAVRAIRVERGLSAKMQV